MRVSRVLVPLAAGGLVLACGPKATVVGPDACSPNNQPELHVAVSWAYGSTGISPDPATLCVGGNSPNTVAWDAVAPNGYEAELEVQYDATKAKCGDTDSGYLSLPPTVGPTDQVKGTSAADVREGSCWGYVAKLYVEQNGRPVKNSPFTIDPEIVWKK